MRSFAELLAIKPCDMTDEELHTYLETMRDVLEDEQSDRKAWAVTANWCTAQGQHDEAEKYTRRHARTLEFLKSTEAKIDAANLEIQLRKFGRTKLPTRWHVRNERGEMVDATPQLAERLERELQRELAEESRE